MTIDRTLKASFPGHPAPGAQDDMETKYRLVANALRLKEENVRAAIFSEYTLDRVLDEIEKNSQFKRERMIMKASVIVSDVYKALYATSALSCCMIGMKHSNNPYMFLASIAAAGYFFHGLLTMSPPATTKLGDAILDIGNKNEAAMKKDPAPTLYEFQL